MLLHAKLPWADPIFVARLLTEPGPGRVSRELSERYALLYSGARHGHTGRHSYLALLPKEEAIGTSFDDLRPHVGGDGRRLDSAWFGYLGYGVGSSTAAVAESSLAYIAAPALWMVRYRLLLEFDHVLQTISVWADDADAQRALPRLGDLAEPAPRPASAPTGPTSLSSNMDRHAYGVAVARVLAAIRNGDVYQANLTRKFFGSNAGAAAPLHLFETLHARSPASYSCLLQYGSLALVSSSPERFLRVSAEGHANSRPIKGSAARGADPALDQVRRAELLSSDKDRAENLMIVDLARNDLGRSCEIGSIVVDRLFELTSHATIHHLSSSISGRKRADCSTLELIEGCFPPGSMTGAPKLSAMQLCAELEGWQRGIYSGAAGWLGGDGSCDLAVVIRAIVVEGDRFEFQVGGGIVHDSDAASEWQETMTKASAVAATLGITPEQLRSL